MREKIVSVEKGLGDRKNLSKVGSTVMSNIQAAPD